MPTGLDIDLAVKALVAAAVPGATVVGITGDDAPDRISDLGRIVVNSGDPGEPEIDLSPLTYNYNRQIGVEFSANPTETRTAAQIIEDMYGAVATAIEADRTLGGLVDYLDAAAPTSGDESVDGAPITRIGDAVIIASHHTQRPL